MTLPKRGNKKSRSKKSRQRNQAFSIWNGEGGGNLRGGGAPVEKKKDTFLGEKDLWEK